MSARSILAALAALAPLAAAVPAQAARDPDGLLPSLPRSAAPGVCYARVKASAAYSPPTPPHARWVLRPPPPGAPGPLWCLIVEPGAPPVVIRPERFGWIRVLCDDEATPVRIRGLQRRLHERGVYAGEETGRYDPATAAAVSRFQRERRLDHGGYLSMQTLEALEGPGGFAPPPPPPPPPLFIPPPPPPVVTIPVVQPCCAPGGPSGRPGGFLNWPGKSRF